MASSDFLLSWFQSNVSKSSKQKLSVSVSVLGNSCCEMKERVVNSWGWYIEQQEKRRRDRPLSIEHSVLIETDP